MLVCDTSGLLAFFDGSDPDHAPVAQVLHADPGPFVVSPHVITELDYLLGTRRGVAAETTALMELSGGAWELPTLDAADLRRATELIQRYRDQNIGVTDASLAVLAERYRTDRLLTLDRRHFEVIRTLKGKQFVVLP